MRHLIRRVWTCERGAGLVEYGLLLAVLALALAGVLALYRNTVGDVTRRTATTVSRQAGRGYGSSGPVVTGAASAGHTPVGQPAEGEPEPPDSVGTATAARTSGLSIPRSRP